MKFRSITLLLLAEVAGMCLWFVSAAVLPEMSREFAISANRQALMSSGVQAGFVIGALLFSAIGLPDRFDPRRLFSACALLAAAANASLLFWTPGGNMAIAMRVIDGLLFAGIYPVGMKIAVGWGVKDRGFLVSLLIGALTLGSAAPHAFAWFGQADWRAVVLASSVIAAMGGILVLFVGLGPFHAQSPRFDPAAVRTALSDGRIRLAYAGYFGHMWELYAMWAWIGTAVAVSYAAVMPAPAAASLAKLTAFTAIAAGGIVSIGAGLYADRFGKARTAVIAMAVSGSAALLTALTFGGPWWITFVLVVIWGISIVPDSAQFSALVADYSPPAQAGSIMTLQTALGFMLTVVTVQLAPLAAATVGWPLVLAGLAIGPALGLVAMIRLVPIEDAGRRLAADQQTASIR